MSLIVLSIEGHGVQVPVADPVLAELKHRLSKHTTPDSIPYLQYMIGIEERSMKLLRGRPYERCRLRLHLYQSQLASIQARDSLH